MRLYLSSFHLGNKPQELLTLLDGRKRAIVIANALDFPGAEDRRAQYVKQEIEDLKKLGLEPREIDLRQYFGKTEELQTQLANVDLLWVTGGNCFILRRAFHQSGADRVIKEFLLRDALVYAGFSAGIDMLTPSLHGIELVDDPHVISAGYGSEIIWEGLGLVPYAIAPHYKSDHPESEAIDKSVEYLINNHIPFIALRDGEVIVRNGDREFVAR